MLTYLLCHFTSITLSYFQFSTVIKIDLIQENTTINYYSVMQDYDWENLFNSFLCNCSDWDQSDLAQYARNLFNLKDNQFEDAVTINQLLTELIKINKTYEFYNTYYFYYDPYNQYKQYDKVDHIHHGYIIKDIFTDKRFQKFWTYSFNKSINSNKIKVIFYYKS